MRVYRMTRPAAAANPLLLLPALHDALGAWGTAPGREHAEALRDGLRAHVLAALRECSTDSRPVPSRRAAAALWVSLKALQRWTAPGGCASPPPSARSSARRATRRPERHPL